MNSTQDFKTLTIFIGGHGSGKSEMALSFLMHLKSEGYSPLTLVDLDVVKPMFRSRAAKEFLEGEGIKLFASQSPHSDLPYLGGEIGGVLAGGEGYRVVDCGGDAQGVRVLRSLKDHFESQDYDLWYVINIMRPFCSTEEQVREEVLRIERTSYLKITGLISNSHLLGMENIELIKKGIRITTGVADSLGLPVKFVGLKEAEGLDSSVIQQDGPPFLYVESRVGFNPESGTDYGAFGI